MISPLLMLQARAEARAVLWRCSEFELVEALDPLFRQALALGLVDRLGEASVKAIIEAPFVARREEQGGADG